MTLWAERDEPVLRHLLSQPPAHGILWAQRVSNQPHESLPELTEADVYRSLEVLHDAGYVTWGHTEADGSGERMFADFQVTGAGKQALGVWPHFDALGSPGELADLLDALAGDVATEEERGYLRRASDAVRQTSPEVLKRMAVAGLSAYARRHVGV